MTRDTKVIAGAANILLTLPSAQRTTIVEMLFSTLDEFDRADSALVMMSGEHTKLKGAAFDSYELVDLLIWGEDDEDKGKDG